MPDAEFEDKRIFDRLAVRMPLRFLDVDSNKEGVAETRDISAKGIGFTTTQELAARTPLEMWLHVPDKGEPFYTRGKVIWSAPRGASGYRVGVNLEKADLMGLSRVLRAAS